MNSVLAELQKEREERARAAAATSGGSSQGPEGAVAGGQEADGAAQQASGRKRKQSAPQRRIPGGGGQPLAGGAEGAAASGGATPTAGPPAHKAEEKKEKKKRKPSGPAKPSEGDFVSDLGGFDAASIAQAWALGEFFEGRGSYGEIAHDQITSAARAHSVASGKAVVEEAAEEEGKLVVSFVGTSGKKFRDRCEGYSEAQVGEVVGAFLKRNQSSRSGRRTSQGHLVTVEGLAEKAPPVLWSLYRVHGKGTQAALKDLVQSFS